jgi:hypothetical protein
VICSGVPRLLVAFSDCEQSITASVDGGEIHVTVGGDTIALTRETAAQLRDVVGDALTRREEFFRTACEHREDGSFVVERRGANTTGNSTVFDSFEEARRLFERLPESFTVEDVSSGGITGSRRHMLVRHFAEHPAFACALASQSPLEAEKTG